MNYISIKLLKKIKPKAVPWEYQHINRKMIQCRNRGTHGQKRGVVQKPGRKSFKKQSVANSVKYKKDQLSERLKYLI